jgi:hypothetical protein
MSSPSLVARRDVSSVSAVRDWARHLARWQWLALGLALVGIANLIVLFGSIPALVHQIYLNADHANALVLPALVGHAPPGAVTYLGDHPWYEPWWFMRATAGLPGYRQLWELAPFVAGLLGTAAVSTCAWRAFGGLAGLLCAVALVAASESARNVLYVPESHGLTVLHGGALCGALLFVYARAITGRLTSRALVFLGVPLVLFTGAGVTDQLLIVSGLVPFVVAPVLCWLRSRSGAWRTISVFAITTAVLSVLVALVANSVMRDQHVLPAPFPISFLGRESVLANLQDLATSFASLGGGEFFGAPVRGAYLLAFVTGVLVLLAVGAVLRGAWRWSTSTTLSDAPTPPDSGLRDLFVAYWSVSLICVLAAIALTSISGPVADGRYLVGAWAAVAALLGTLIRSSTARWIMIAAVTVFGALNLRTELSERVPPFGPAPDQRLAGAIEHFVTANGASIGYSGYWDSAPVTWETRLRLQVYPIIACPSPSGWCRFSEEQISSWYTPRPHTRTFLIVDSRPGVTIPVSAAPPSFGRPLAHATVGNGLAVYVYAGDIASDLGS